MVIGRKAYISVDHSSDYLRVRSLCVLVVINPFIELRILGDIQVKDFVQHAITSGRIRTCAIASRSESNVGS